MTKTKIATTKGKPILSDLIVQADFDRKSLVPGKQYELVMQGTYRTGHEDDDKDKDRDDKGQTHSFKVHTVVVIPPASPGKQEVGTTKAPAHKVEGGKYPPQKPRMDN